jgi:hypothetical protein
VTKTLTLSYILLWAVVLFQGVALFILYSHVGQTLLNSREGHRFQGPGLNARLEPLVLTALSGVRYVLGGPSSALRLIVFVSPKCISCRELLKALPEFVQRFGARVETVLVCRGGAQEVSAFTSSVPEDVVICADTRGEFMSAYGILVTPFAFCVDSEGFVRYKGVPGTDAAALSHLVARSLRGQPLGQGTDELTLVPGTHTRRSSPSTASAIGG